VRVHIFKVFALRKLLDAIKQFFPIPSWKRPVGIDQYQLTGFWELTYQHFSEFDYPSWLTKCGIISRESRNIMLFSTPVFSLSS